LIKHFDELHLFQLHSANGLKRRYSVEGRGSTNHGKHWKGPATWEAAPPFVVPMSAAHYILSFDFGLSAIFFLYTYFSI